MMYRTVTITPKLTDSVISMTASLVDSVISVSTDFYSSVRSYGGEVDFYEGSYEVTPLANSSVVLETQGKVMTDDVTVLEIPYYETSNTSGYTVYIGSEV